MLAMTNPVEAQLARAAVSRQLVVWAIGNGELGAFLESSMSSIEESAVHDILVMQWENELEAGLMLHVFHDILLAWYIHRDRHQDARAIMHKFRCVCVCVYVGVSCV